MKIITHQIDTLYRHDGQLYKASKKSHIDVGDVIIDGRDYNFKLIESNQDVFDMSFVDPALYVILEETTIQN